MAGHSRRRFGFGARAAVGVVAVIALVGAAWAADTGALGGDVVRNVTLVGPGADPDLGGASRADVDTEVAAMADRFAAAKVTIDAGSHTYTTTPADLGVTLDEAATAAAVVDAGRSGPWVARPVSWVRSIASPWRVTPIVAVDDDTLSREVVAIQGSDYTAPIEPSVDATDTGLHLVAGVAGSGVDPDAVGKGLSAAVADGDDTYVLHAPIGAVPPRVSDADASAAIADIDAATASGVTVAVGADQAAVDGPTVRSWVRLDTAEGTATIVLDPDAVTSGLAGLFPADNAPAVDAHFDVVDGRPVVVPSADGSVCCGADAPQTILDALDQPGTVATLQTTVLPAAFTTEQANALGIVEEVGQPTAFGPTTNHAAGKPRVVNIHRIADIVRGVVIKPGQTFSVNGYVGERTTAKGFVDAPVIYEGSFSHDVGGGVSQFATTFFNAALFAGLDFGEYQSHSIIISRYPTGHEATISYPHPDLEIENSTPYGVLVWPTYTDTSITVHLYSTHYVDVALGAASQEPVGNCTQWTTPRTRAYTDGHTDADSVRAVYRPAEGVSC